MSCGPSALVLIENGQISYFDAACELLSVFRTMEWKARFSMERI